jgi:hypothetical protein
MNWDEVGVPYLHTPGSEPTAGSRMSVDWGVYAPESYRADRRHAYFRSDRLWWWDARKDEDPRHQWQIDRGYPVICLRCQRYIADILREHIESCAYDHPRTVAGDFHCNGPRVEWLCEGERRKREGWADAD